MRFSDAGMSQGKTGGWQWRGRIFNGGRKKEWVKGEADAPGGGWSGRVPIHANRQKSLRTGPGGGPGESDGLLDR